MMHVLLTSWVLVFLKTLATKTLQHMRSFAPSLTAEDTASLLCVGFFFFFFNNQSPVLSGIG